MPGGKNGDNGEQRQQAVTGLQREQFDIVFETRSRQAMEGRDLQQQQRMETGSRITLEGEMSKSIDTSGQDLRLRSMVQVARHEQISWRTLMGAVISIT